MPESGLRVLLIEDDVVDREMVHRFARGSFSVTDAESGIQGVECATTLRPDCILLGCRLPDTDSLEVLDQILGGRRIVPVVMLAESADDDLVDRALQVGAFGYLTKDQVTAQSLKSAILGAVRGASVQRDLEAARRELDHLTSTIANDLRGPLRRIVHVVRDARSERPYLDPAMREDLSSLEDSAIQMASKVEDLVEHSLVGRGDKPFECVDLNQVLMRVLDQLALSIQKSRAVIEAEPLPTVWGDRASLGQLLKNLLSNAIKFHGQGTPIVRVAAALKNELWEISIQDNGIGIEPHHQSLIFSPFKRLHEGGELGEGLGLGLTTAERIAEKHGSRIRVFSKPGHGSIFRLTLQAAALEMKRPEGVRPVPAR